MGKEPIFVRPLTDAERGELEVSPREVDAIVVRRANAGPNVLSLSRMMYLGR